MEKEMEDIKKNERDREISGEDEHEGDEEHETLKYKGESTKHVEEKYIRITGTVQSRDILFIIQILLSLPHDNNAFCISYFRQEEETGSTSADVQ